MFLRKIFGAFESPAKPSQPSGSVSIGASWGSPGCLFVPTFSPTHLVPCLSSNSKMNTLNKNKSPSAIPYTLSVGLISRENLGRPGSNEIQ